MVPVIASFPMFPPLKKRGFTVNPSMVKANLPEELNIRAESSNFESIGLSKYFKKNSFIRKKVSSPPPP